MKLHPQAAFPILQVRADNTPNSDKRIRDINSVVDKYGHAITEPDQHPELIALEGNPNLSFEHYGEFWRKVHGPRVAYAGGKDYMCSGVSEYYQVQRVSAAPSSAFPPPYSPLVDEYGELYDFIYDKVPTYHRPAFDGLVYWAAPTKKKLEPVGTSNHATQKIGHEGELFTRGSAASLCAEYIIIPCTSASLPPVCTVKIHYRKSGTQQEFQHKLLHSHCDIIAQGPEAQKHIKRFAYLFNINLDPNELFYSEAGVQIDAISVTYFKDMGDCEAYYSSEEYQKIQALEDKFLDTERSEWWTGIVYPIIVTPDLDVTDRNLSVK